jgi:hypothetical protein
MSWPVAWRLQINGEQAEWATSHPLAAELCALGDGSPGGAVSLPHFGNDRVTWLTIAPDADRLQAVIQDLRAWLIPSFAWEDSRRAIVATTEDGAPLAAALRELSPAGYYRWCSLKNDAAVIARKLASLRRVIAARPHRQSEEAPSLLELRQAFAVALAAGNRDAAASAVNAIDEHQLDATANTGFMRILLHDRFGEIDAIVGCEATRRLAALRMPLRVRTAVLRAYHRVFLIAPEQDHDAGKIQEVYAARIAPDIGGLVAASKPAEGPEVRRLLACHALLRSDAALALDLLRVETDTFLASLLAPLLRAPQRSLEERFYDARARQDWQQVQELGALWLAEADAEEPLPILRRSLDFLANPQLQSRLTARTSATTRTEPAEPPAPALQDWAEWMAALLHADWDAATFYLENVNHPEVASAPAATITALIAALEEVYTGASIVPNSPLERLLLLGLPQMVDEFCRAPGFPNAAWSDLYLGMLLMWSYVKAGSTLPADCDLLLTLAIAVAQVSVREEGQVIDHLRRWWNVRPTRRMIRYGLQAVDLMLDNTANRTAAEDLWCSVAVVASQNRDGLTEGERSLLRYLGRRLQIDAGVIEGYVPIEMTKAEADPIRAAGWRRVAIIHSWVPDAAQRAAELLQTRTDAEVTVIGAEDAAGLTRRASNADVILYVWRRSSHAVFYGFDAAMRKKLAYVAGTTATSILMAAEDRAGKEREAISHFS